MGEKSGKGGKSERSQSLSFLALGLSRFNPIPLALCALRQIDIGRPSQAFPVTPPCIRVRTRRFGGLGDYVGTKEGIPSFSK
jgi:hypothetical protein